MKQEKQNIAQGNAPERTSQANVTPWNEWLRLARQGDESAKLRFCAQAEPFIETFCKIRFFTETLGEEEVRSIATLATLEFLMTYPSPPQDGDFPFMLRKILRTTLLARMKRANARGRHEMKMFALRDTVDGVTEENIAELVPADSKEEPETKLLEKEMSLTATKALAQLKSSEQAMLRAYFFQNKTAAAIAKDLQCSRQYVEKMRNKALNHLRELLEGYHIFYDGAFGC